MTKITKLRLHLLKLFRENYWRHVTAEGASLAASAWKLEFKLSEVERQWAGRHTLLTVYSKWQTSSHVDACSPLNSSSTQVVPVTRRATLGDRSFPVAAIRALNALGALPDFVLAARRSLPRWRSICCLVPSDNDNTRHHHTHFIRCSSLAVFQPMWSRYLNVTKRRTDRRHTMA